MKSKKLETTELEFTVYIAYVCVLISSTPVFALALYNCYWYTQITSPYCLWTDSEN